MTKFDRMLDHIFKPDPEEEVDTLTILDGFGREWEVTPLEYARFTVPPRLHLGSRPRRKGA